MDIKLSVKAYFRDIHSVILDYIQKAENEILIAVAWFTDLELFDALCKKAQQGLSIRLVLIDDEINRGVGKLNFVRLQNLKAQITFLETQNFNRMHHKFCIIDQKIVITGSYNWTKQARNNEENITVIKDEVHIYDDYSAIFNQLVDPQVSISTIKLSPDAVKRRLEMIKNFIFLDETENIPSQLSKLAPVIESYKLEQIHTFLEKGAYQQAAEEITIFLKNFTAIVVSEDHEANELKFELKILELRLESITNEKADLERDILLFNRRQYEILGDLIKELLRLKAEYQQCIAEQAKQEQNQEQEEIDELEEEAEQAKDTYDEYSEEYEEVQQTEVKQLNELEEKELKNIFRRACNLCHPDKVTEEKKGQASQIFIQLKEAYDKNDIAAVKIVYAKLQQGDFSQTKSSKLKSIDILRSSISEIKYKLEQAIQALHKLSTDPVTMTINQIGKNESQWVDYLHNKRVSFEGEIAAWQEKLEQLRVGEFNEK